MKLFQEDGHISQDGLNALIREELDETQRMEVSEHLDFCDICIDRYSGMLTEEVLVVPPVEFVPQVMQNVRSKTRIVVLKRFVRVAVAAVMALVVWNGAFLGGDGLTTRSAEWVNSHPKNDFSLSQTVDGWGKGLDQLMNGLNSWFNSGVQRNFDSGRNS
ncbi:MAG: zf-HC2 domain-containing protein [Candidatus Merdivicinus sp.]|jgi:hypothetical protein